MPSPTVLDREFLSIRCRLIDLAAALDRVDRADDDSVADPRCKPIGEALRALAASTPDRAEQVQRLFSLPYDENWREKFGVSSS